MQERWHPDAAEHQEALAAGIRTAAAEGARLVCLQELTLSPYFAITPDGPRAAGAEPEELEFGPTAGFARRLAAETGAHVHASLYERADGADGLGYNTAIVVAPDGQVLSRTRKLHIPVTAGYYEDRYFRPGPAEGDPFPVTAITIDVGEGAPAIGRPLAVRRRASDSRPAGISGSRSSRARTRWPVRRCSSTRRRLGQNPTIRASTPSRSGSG